MRAIKPRLIGRDVLPEDLDNYNMESIKSKITNYTVAIAKAMSKKLAH